MDIELSISSTSKSPLSGVGMTLSNWCLRNQIPPIYTDLLTVGIGESSGRELCVMFGRYLNNRYKILLWVHKKSILSCKLDKDAQQNYMFTRKVIMKNEKEDYTLLKRHLSQAEFAEGLLTGFDTLYKRLLSTDAERVKQFEIIYFKEADRQCSKGSIVHQAYCDFMAERNQDYFNDETSDEELDVISLYLNNAFSSYMDKKYPFIFSAFYEYMCGDDGNTDELFEPIYDFVREFAGVEIIVQ